MRKEGLRKGEARTLRLQLGLPLVLLESGRLLISDMSKRGIERFLITISNPNYTQSHRKEGKREIGRRTGGRTNVSST